MFTPEVTQSKSDYFEHFVPSMMLNNNLVSPTFLSPTPSTYSDGGSYQQSPLSIYNNYNPNYHHHHYYFHANFQDYNYNQQQSIGSHQESGSNWMRKYDYENQKEYFIANTPPTPSECCDFEVPQRIVQSPKPTAAKLFNDLDKIFFDDENLNKMKLNQMTRVSGDSNDTCSFWESENLFSGKTLKKNFKNKEKIKKENCVKNEIKNGKQSKRISNDYGEFQLSQNKLLWKMLSCHLNNFNTKMLSPSLNLQFFH